ncbi:Retrovirus-related Pol polyprotein from transposon TNT 1-94 [Symbiodinium microadriaticum]|uniref:Retrovirus-related Pol polyprotein from transposon TNT 1-94 n=1 Tax=Symbiodinium microadriaticum TaxID=2951 RepID=A0A1Q9E194_SYMMI|nr:Retrovirus-related Pol polyprotein from transposon TNT 1-94 [Symbiodinium microadriaticum]CAE7037961.1 unnamed protein product [Symbiodinium sp. KB8]CAE7875498.1 unnamed protein product [Symbiodinium microadriaticum]
MSPSGSMGTPRETPRETRVDDEVLEPAYSDLSLGPSGRPVATAILEAMDPGVVTGGTGPGAAPMGAITAGTGPGEANTAAALEVAADSPMRLSTSLSSMERGRTVAREERRRAPSTASAGTTDARLDRLTGLMEAMLVRMDDERRSQGAIVVEPPEAERPVTPVKPRSEVFDPSSHSVPPSGAGFAFLCQIRGAVILGDWLVTITPVIGSLTPGAATWFTEVLARVNEHYALWLASDQVTRLTIRTRAIADGANASSQGGTALLEQRLTTLLLEAVPSAVKTEVITVRALTTVGILFLLHTRYQPAGQAEKASILQFLVSPDAPKDTQQAVKNLRRWLRWLARSTELQLAPPDASLLVKAVDKLGAAFLSDPSAVFRVQAFRLQNSIDHLPSQDSSVSLAQLYLAELETLLLVAPDPKKQRVAALEVQVRRNRRSSSRLSGSRALCSNGKGLIDGGATCCLRSAKNTFEWNESTPTSIRLAVGEVTARVSPAGTLLLPPGSSCDPIVALHELIRIGYRMTFLSVNKMRIWRPGQPDLPLDCSTGCPEITPDEANRLITEIENSKRVNRAQVARLTQLPTSSFEDVLQALAYLGRRPLQESCAVEPPTEANLGWDVLEVDIEEDLLREDTFGFLLHLAQTGPPPVRRVGSDAWGLPGLSAATQAMVDQDSALYLRMFMLTSVARRAGRALRRSESPDWSDLNQPEAQEAQWAQHLAQAASSSAAAPSRDPSNREPADGSVPPDLLDIELGFADLFDEEGEASEDLLPVLDAPADPEDLRDPLTPSQTAAADAENEAWQEQFDALTDEWKDSPLPAVSMQDVPFFVPLESKSGKNVSGAVMQVVTQVRALGFPIHRLHSDRGREFRNASRAHFTRFHCLTHTTTTGDDFRANGRTENVIRQLKRAARTLLRAHDAPPSAWSFAMRHACARLRASALSVLGQPSPKLLPWRARLVLRRRTWSRLAAGSWGSRALMVTVLCPSPDVPGGHLVVTDDGGYLHSDVLVEVGEAVELQEFAGRPPPTRLRDKQPDIRPSVAAQRRGGGCENVFSSEFSSLVPARSPTVPSGPGDHVQVPPGPGDCTQVLPELPLTGPSGSSDHVQVPPGPGDRTQALPELPPTRPSGPSDHVRVPPGPGDRTQVLPESPRTGYSCPGDRAQAQGLEVCQRPWTPVQDAPPRVAMATNRPRTPGYNIHDRGSQDDDIYYAYVTAEQASILDAQFPDFDNFVCRNLSLHWERVEPVYPPSPNEHEQVLWDQRFRDWILDPELRFVVAEDPEEASEEEDELRRVPQTTSVLDVASSEALAFALLSRPVLTAEAHPTATFSALAIIGNCHQSCHHDLVNEKGALNYLFPLSSFKGGDLWIEDASVPEEEAVHRFVPSPQGQELRKGKIVLVRPALAFDARRFHEVQELQGERWMPVGYTPRRLDALPETDKAYDFVQYNLKKLGRQARRLWGQANDTGDGEEVAELVRSIDHQVCSLEWVLDRASSDTAEAPPLLPDAAEKQLAGFLEEEEDTPSPQLCVARAVDPPAAASTERPLKASPEDSNVPLQTRTVTLVEVLSELELWLPSWKEEYSSLVHQHKAVRPLTQQDVEKWKREGVEYQLIPSKLVHTLKAHTGRRKARCVCCGNMESHSIYHKHECYAGAADATTLRALLRIASAHRWAVSSFDVRTAFLQSRLLTANRVPTVVKVPWLWRKHCICVEEFWLVEGALYGLCISPRSWCESRDSTMSSATTTFGDMTVRLVRFETDPHVWWVKGLKPSGETVVLGCVAWYIDDALILAEPDFSKNVTEFIAGLWSTTPPEYLVPGQVLVYYGFEIEQDGPYLHLHQKSFVAELLSRYPGHESSDVPAVPRPGPIQEEERDVVLTRKCQALCGEMLWLSIRTRPDLSFAVSMMAQCMAARPTEAWERGLQMLKFLRKHPGIALGYGPPSSSLAVASAMSDASFAPDASRSHQCSLTFLGGSLITWSSGRQNFITQSTCEAELVALVQGLQDLESQLPLFRELLPGSQVECRLLCDNKAAVAICQAPFGSWRSRMKRCQCNDLDGGIYTKSLNS